MSYIVAANYVPRAKSGAYDCLIVQGLDLDGRVGYGTDCVVGIKLINMLGKHNWFTAK